MLPVNSSNLSRRVVYQPGDIVYVAHNPRCRPGGNWPAIDSEYEIDCKIQEIYGNHPDPRNNTYVLISGHGALFESSGVFIVHPKDKALFSRCDTKIALEDTELFPKNTVFSLVGDYYSNEEVGVFIHIDRMEKINHLFN